MIGYLSMLEVPQVARVARRSALGALGLGALGVVVAALIGEALGGVGGCVGLGLGLGNFRLAVRDAVRASSLGSARRLGFGTLWRLAAVSAVALGLLFASRELGAGALVGIALFQVVLIVALATELVRGLPKGPGPSVGVGADGLAEEDGGGSR
jgi:hypothetical protein